MARYLGPEKFGILSYVLAITAIIGSIIRLGLDGILVRELVKSPEQRNEFLGTAFWLKVLGTLLIIIILLIFLPFTKNTSTINLYIILISFGFLFQSFEVVEFYFQSIVRLKAVSICKGVQLVLSSIIKIYLIFTESELLLFVLVIVFDTISLAFSYFVVYKRHAKSSFYKNFDFKIALNLMRDSWPLILSAVTIMLYMRIDQIMIYTMLGQYQVGIYSVAVRLSEVSYFSAMIVLSTLFPAILRAKKTSKDLYEKRLLLMYTLSVWSAVIIALIISIFGDWIVTSLFGPAYKEAGSILQIYVWATIFVFLSITSGKFLVAENLTKVAFQRALVGAIVNIGLNFLLIPPYGIEGAAIATLLGQFTAAYVYDLMDRRLHKQFLFKTQAMFMPWLCLK